LKIRIITLITYSAMSTSRHRALFYGAREQKFKQYIYIYIYIAKKKKAILYDFACVEALPMKANAVFSSMAG